MFPVLLAIGLGVAFRNKPADVVPVGVVRGAGSDAIVTSLKASSVLETHELPTLDSALASMRNGRVPVSPPRLRISQAMTDPAKRHRDSAPAPAGEDAGPTHRPDGRSPSPQAGRDHPPTTLRLRLRVVPPPRSFGRGGIAARCNRCPRPRQFQCCAPPRRHRRAGERRARRLSRQAEPRAARRGRGDRRAGAGAGRRRHRQDARADHPHRPSPRHRPRPALARSSPSPSPTRRRAR